jgi:hypothetical protein
MQNLPTSNLTASGGTPTDALSDERQRLIENLAVLVVRQYRRVLRESQDGNSGSGNSDGLQASATPEGVPS